MAHGQVVDVDDYRKAFDKFDTDGSGHLSAADFANFGTVSGADDAWSSASLGANCTDHGTGFSNLSSMVEPFSQFGGQCWQFG